MKRLILVALFVGFLMGFVFTSGGCDVTASGLSGLINPDCFVEGALGEGEYGDLPILEQALYVRNSCGLYVKRNIKNVFDDVDDWF